jgi:hypothetical protein
LTREYQTTEQAEGWKNVKGWRRLSDLDNRIDSCLYGNKILFIQQLYLQSLGALGIPYCGIDMFVSIIILDGSISAWSVGK